MLKPPPTPKYAAGTRVKVVQRLRCGHRRWTTQVVGVVEAEGMRPVGGTEMGGRTTYVLQPTIRLRREDGEVTVVALDEQTEVTVVAAD